MLQRMSLVAGRQASRVIRSIPKPTAAVVMSTLASTSSSSSSSSSAEGGFSRDFSAPKLVLAAVAALGGAAAAATTVVSCEPAPAHPHFTPSQVGKEAFPVPGEDYEDEMAKYPIFTSDQVAENDGSDGKPIWMSVRVISILAILGSRWLIRSFIHVHYIMPHPFGCSLLTFQYGGVVYDVTDFIANHPGGSEKVRSRRRRLLFRCFFDDILL